MNLAAQAPLLLLGFVLAVVGLSLLLSLHCTKLGVLVLTYAYDFSVQFLCIIAFVINVLTEVLQCLYLLAC